MFEIDEFPGLFADACIRDLNGAVIFLSVFGRDTGLRQMTSAFHLGAARDGVDEINLTSVSTLEKCNARIGDASVLEFHTGRLQTELFGDIVHGWIYNPMLEKPDFKSRLGWIIQPNMSEDQLAKRIWEFYKALSPLPLMDHWKESVLLSTKDYVTNLSDCDYPPIGKLQAIRVHLGLDFNQRLSSLVKSHEITLDARGLNEANRMTANT